jgi:hypothetical protein
MCHIEYLELERRARVREKSHSDPEESESDRGAGKNIIEINNFWLTSTTSLVILAICTFVTYYI